MIGHSWRFLKQGRSLMPRAFVAVVGLILTLGRITASLSHEISSRTILKDAKITLRKKKVSCLLGSPKLAPKIYPGRFFRKEPRASMQRSVVAGEVMSLLFYLKNNWIEEGSAKIARTNLGTIEI